MKRKAFRKRKKEAFKKILKASETELNIDLNNSEFIDVFTQIWPILKPVLEYAELLRITRNKVDKVIRVLIDIGDRIFTNNAFKDDQTAFIRCFDSIWKYLELIFRITKTFTGNKADKAIDKIIEIGDWITNDKTN